MIKILLLIVILVSFTTAVAQSRDTAASQVEVGLAAQKVHYIFQNSATSNSEVTLALLRFLDRSAQDPVGHGFQDLRRDRFLDLTVFGE